tara:strand:+ start:182 stop:1222 length:1041 start_codon:yes stop_codon:yes gene_type:complete
MPFQVKIGQEELAGLRAENADMRTCILAWKNENAELKKWKEEAESATKLRQSDFQKLSDEIVKLKTYIADYVVGGGKPKKTRTHKKSDSGDEAPRPRSPRRAKEQLTFSTEDKKIMSSIVEAGGAHHPIQYSKKLCSYTLKRGFGGTYYSTLKEAVEVMMKNQKCQERNGAFVKSREGWTIRSYAEAEGRFALQTNNRLHQGGEEWVGFSADTNSDRVMAQFKFKQIYDKIDFEDTTADEDMIADAGWGHIETPTLPTTEEVLGSKAEVVDVEEPTEDAEETEEEETVDVEHCLMKDGEMIYIVFDEETDDFVKLYNSEKNEIDINKYTKDDIEKRVVEEEEEEEE